MIRAAAIWRTGGGDLEGRDLGAREWGPAMWGTGSGRPLWGTGEWAGRDVALAAGRPAVGGLAVGGPYADMDTIDEPDATALAARARFRACPAMPPPRIRPAPAVPRGGGLACAAPAGTGDRPRRAGVPGTGGVRPAAAPPPTSGGSVLAWLWGEQGQAGEYLLASRSVTVGRGPGSDIVLHDRTVSREHARFEYDGSQWWLLPVGSAGPTWINGQPLAPGQRLPVTDGDRLRFGFHTQLRLLVPGARG